MKKWIACACILLTAALTAACSGAGLFAEPTPAPEKLDLSGQGLTDISYLKEYTWLSSLDLRDNEISVSDYLALAEALPDCDIRWSVPIAGERVDSRKSVLSVERFDMDDVETLACFGGLKEVDARGCTDYDALLAAAARYTDVRFLWTVEIGGVTLGNEETSLDLDDTAVTYAALSEALSRLPAAEQVSLYNVPLDDGDKLALVTDFPELSFLWTVGVLDGVTADSADVELDLREHTVTDVDALIEKLRLLPGLGSLDMCECGPSNEEMMRIREALPEVKVIWMVDVAGYRIRTDLKGFSMGVITYFPDGGGYRTGVDGHAYGNSAFQNLVYCTDLIALDIGHCKNVTDISFIAKLPKLKYLIIAMTGVSDISALASQTELEYLEFFDCFVSDITPLLNCKKIKCLNCSNNPFTDLDTLLSLTELERLWMTASALTDEQLAELKAAFPNTFINVSRDRQAMDHVWRKGNWAYVDMQRIYGMRAQFQGGVTPTLEPTATPAATPSP